ncbi:MAG: ABC transporter permease [Nocardioidaceae bacterium]|nr:ABC transporter permease [Nocardioidaceae bacterium]
MSQAVAGVHASSRSGRRMALPRFHQVAAVVLVLVAVVAIAAPWLAPYSPSAQSLDQIRPPSGAHALGTDALGRDILSRMMYALRTDLLLIVPAAGLPMVVGTVVGTLAGYAGGVLDAAVRWIADVFQGLPLYIFLVALVAAMGRGPASLLVAFTALGWIVYARLVRTEVRRIKTAGFVEAAYLLGRSSPQVLVQHVLPHALKQTATYFVLDLGMALQGVAVLSFFNLGVKSGTPELGAMVADAQIFIRSSTWMVALPGAAIVVLGVCIAAVGDHLSSRTRGESDGR